MKHLILLTTEPQGYNLKVTPSSYSEAVKQQFQGMPGVVWDPAQRCYLGAREAVEPILKTLRAAKVAATWPEDNIWRDHGSLGLALTAGAAFPPGLRDYQRFGARWLVSMLHDQGAALLADEMGLGKSAQAVVAINALGLRANIVCPAVVREHWRKQLLRWGTDFCKLWNIYSYEGFLKALKANIVPPADALIIDEAHYLSNPKALRTKAIVEWLNKQPNRPKIVALSGTPMTSRPRDLHSPLDILWPGRFGKAWKFQARYCAGHFEEIPLEAGMKRRVWVADGVSRAEELHERLSAVMLRRTKAEVASELPSLTREVIEVELPLKARRASAKAAKASELDKTSLQGLLSGLEDHKLEAAVELARNILASGGRPLLVTTLKETARKLGDELLCPFVTGDDPPELRREFLLGDCQIRLPGVATIYSITTGIDLTEFSSLIFVGLDWVPSTLLQAEARLHRLGQDKAVTIFYLVGLGTLDELVRDRVLFKLDSVEAIVGQGSDGLANSLAGGSDEVLLSKLVQSMKAKP